MWLIKWKDSISTSQRTEIFYITYKGVRGSYIYFWNLLKVLLKYKIQKNICHIIQLEKIKFAETPTIISKVIQVEATALYFTIEHQYIYLNCELRVTYKYRHRISNFFYCLLYKRYGSDSFLIMTYIDVVGVIFGLRPLTFTASRSKVLLPWLYSLWYRFLVLVDYF